MNPGSWMLDVLAGADSSGGDAATPAPTPAAAAPVISSGGDLDDTPVAKASLVVAASPTAAAGAGGSTGAKTSFLDGRQLQEEYYASAVWAAQQPGVEAACAAPVGAKPFTFPSVYARSWGFQVGDGRGGEEYARYCR